MIELLAVIVILVIIALIAIPIILGIIKDTKEKTITRSVENYLRAVELSVAHQHMLNEKVPITGEYEIKKKGKLIKSLENEDIEFDVEYEGYGIAEGKIKLIDGKVRETKEIKSIEGYYIKIVLGEVRLLKELRKSELTIGEKFNDKIKTIINGKIVKSIEFLGYGMLSQEYKLEEFQKLSKVDVSSQENGTIYVIYYEIDKVYIYTEDEFIFNKNSSSMFYNFNAVETILLIQVK